LNCAFYKIRQIGFVVGVITKANLTITAALNDMMGNARNIDAESTGHDISFINEWPF
jgi:hypothetical protein